MAITKSFAGNSILKTGAYSRFAVDNSAGSDLGSNNIMFLIGESAKGAPGSVSGIVEFSSSRLQTLVETYGSGPLIDAAVAAVRPSVTPGVGGVGRILVYKTNASLQASATLLQGVLPMYSILGRAYGADDNLFSISVAAGTLATQKLISITRLGGTTESLGENADQTILTVNYTGDASTAVLDIAGITRNAQTFNIVLAGDQTDGSVDFSMNLNTVTVNQLCDAINAALGYTCTLGVISQSAKSATELDPVAAVSVLATPTELKRLQLEVLDIINASARVIATEAAQPLGGVPDNVTAPLTGGTQGASTNSSFSAGMADSLAEEYSVLLPAISRDASVDIADVDLGFTDAASTYTIASVLAAASAHLSVRGSVKNRREAQGWGGFRDALKANSFTAIAGINDANMQVTMQDVVFIDATGNLKVGQPHILAAMMAGIRLGTDVAEPLTFKNIRANGVGHFINPSTGLEAGDFNSGLDADAAIEAGVTFVESQNGGFRIVVDNTTYQTDGSFLFNRGSVVEAVYFVNRTLRQTIEDVFIGQKVSNGLAESIKNVVRNKLFELNAPDVQIITSSIGAPNGFREDTFVVSVSGNTATITVEYVPTQGLDFAFFNFTVGDIQQIA